MKTNRPFSKKDLEENLSHANEFIESLEKIRQAHLCLGNLEEESRFKDTIEKINWIVKNTDPVLNVLYRGEKNLLRIDLLKEQVVQTCSDITGVSCKFAYAEEDKFDKTVDLCFLLRENLSKEQAEELVTSLENYFEGEVQASYENRKKYTFF